MALATAADLGRYLGRELTEDEVFRATLLLDLATAAVKDYTGQDIERVTADSQVLQGNWGSTLILPQRPVISVTSVTISTTTLTANTDYAWDGGDVLYRGSREYLHGGEPYTPDPMRHLLHWGGPSAQVTVVYTHGLADGSKKLDTPRGIVLEMAATQLSTTPGIKQESIGQYSYTADSPATGRVTLTADMRRALRKAGFKR